MNEEFQNILDLEQWDKAYEMLLADKKLVSEVDTDYLAMKKFQYALVENGKDKHIFPNTNPIDLTRTISLCKQLGLLAENIPSATSFQDINQIEILLENGHQLDEHSFGERTGLIVASALNDLELVKYFIDKGAFVSFYDYENFEAIDYTTNDDIVTLLKSKGGKTKEQRNEDYNEYCDSREKLNVLRDVNNDFIRAAKSDNFEKMKEILSQSSMDFWTLNYAYGVNGNTALHFAVENNNIEMIKFLLEKRVNINAKTKDGLTALEVAKNMNREKIIKILESNE